MRAECPHTRGCRPKSDTDSRHGQRPRAAGQGCQSAEVGLIREHPRIDQLACFLSVPLGIAVLHRTSLSVFSDFELDPTGHRTCRSGSGDPPAESLKLEARKILFEMLIVDHIAKKPVEN